MLGCRLTPPCSLPTLHSCSGRAARAAADLDVIRHHLPDVIRRLADDLDEHDGYPTSCNGSAPASGRSACIDSDLSYTSTERAALARSRSTTDLDKLTAYLAAAAHHTELALRLINKYKQHQNTNLNNRNRPKGAYLTVIF